MRVWPPHTAMPAHLEIGLADHGEMLVQSLVDQRRRGADGADHDVLAHGGPFQDSALQWLSRGTPKVAWIFWYLTAGFSTMPWASSSTMPRWISCHGVWLGGYG